MAQHPEVARAHHAAAAPKAALLYHAGIVGGRGTMLLGWPLPPQAHIKLTPIACLHCRLYQWLHFAADKT